MGIYRSSPNKNIISKLQNHQNYTLISASTCGWQLMMQDYTFSFLYTHDVHVFGILDGENGPQVAQYCQNQIQLILQKSGLMELEQYQGAVENLCFALDEKISRNPNKINTIRKAHNLPQLPPNTQTPSFSSLIMCIITPESLTIANLGQCKSYISYCNSPNQVILLSGDHSINSQEDINIVVKKGGFVCDNLINGKIVSKKCIGNLDYKDLQDESKSILSSEPSIFTLRREDVNCIVLGSSGLWERPEIVMKDVLHEGKNPILMKEHIEQLLENLIAQSVDDEFGKQNITINAVFFNNLEQHL